VTGRIDELVLTSFRVDADALRYLDAIVRQHRPNIAGNSAIKYTVQRNDALEYDTADVEQIIRERNGTETRIEAIKLQLDEPQSLTFSVDLAGEARIKGVSEDRAQLLQVASDVGRLMRDRMRGKGARRTTILRAAAAVAFVVGYIVFQQIQTAQVNRLNAQYSAQNSKVTAPYLRQMNALNSSDRALLGKGESSVSKSDLKAEVDFLAQQQINQLRQQVISSNENQATQAAKYPSSPWWATSWWLLTAVASICAAFALGVSYLALPGRASVFLIGDEIRRQVVIERRQRAIWGAGATIAGGVVSSIIFASIT
jgi:hypothetical protein